GQGEQSSRFLFTFKNVVWQPGTVLAVGYDREGRKVTEAAKKTAGSPAAVRLTTRTGPRGLRADGADLAFVDVEVIDAEGNRCPTPAVPSFSISRRPVRIVRATAGANESRATQSYDDNETTDWSNDGQITTAWIKYEFERPAAVGEVAMKLSGWRTQSYPIRIQVDDKVVFSGSTPRSLGYVTFAFPPVTGRTLKVELTGNASNKDAFGNIIEI